MGSGALLSLCGEWWRARRGGRLLFMRSSSIMALISSIIEAALARPLFPGRFSSSATASGISRSVDRPLCRLAAAAGAAAVASGCAGEVGTAGEAGEKAWLRREDRPRTSFCIAVAAVSACASFFSSDATSTWARLLCWRSGHRWRSRRCSRGGSRRCSRDGSRCCSRRSCCGIGLCWRSGHRWRKSMAAARGPAPHQLLHGRRRRLRLCQHSFQRRRLIPWRRSIEPKTAAQCRGILGR